MESKVRLFGHSVHKMLVMFPVGLLMVSVIFDTLAQVVVGPTMALVAYWLLVAGVAGGVLAAPFGTIDWLAIPANTRAKRIGAWHACGNFLVLGLFIASWFLRPGPDGPAPIVALILSWAGAIVLFMTAWMGGELVSRLDVSVSPGAHLDASSSLKGPVERPSEDPVLTREASRPDGALEHGR